MTKFLEPTNEFVYDNEFQNTGDLYLNANRIYVGDSWQVERPTVTVANAAQRAQYLEDFTDFFGAPSPTNPCTVFRADGTSTGLLERTIDGVNWTPLSPVAGDLEMTMASIAPTGWVLAQGQVVENAATLYPALWANAPDWREGSSLVIPDLRGRAPIGPGRQDDNPLKALRTVKSKIGSDAVTLSATEVPLRTHTHGVSLITNANGNHSHGGLRVGTSEISWKTTGTDAIASGSTAGVRGGGSGSDISTTAAGSHTHNVSGNTGSFNESVSTNAHENMQPSIVVNFKVKV